MQRALLILGAAAMLAPTALLAQRARPRETVLGRVVALYPAGDAARPVRGELLAVRPDSAWVLAPDLSRVAAVPMASIRTALVRRHGLTAERGVLWGAALGVIAGVGLSAACSSVEGSSCGGVLVGTTAFGLLLGGLAAPSLASSSRWHITPVTAESLARFARFPQGPPTGVSLDQMADGESGAAAGRPRP